MADLARPGLRPVFPKIWLNVLLAFLFASFFSVGAAVLSVLPPVILYLIFQRWVVKGLTLGGVKG